MTPVEVLAGGTLLAIPIYFVLWYFIEWRNR